MLERQREGIIKAKAEGKYTGRKPTAMAKGEAVLALIKSGMSKQAICDQVGISRASVGDRQFFSGHGCGVCNQTGYKGRLGIYEWLRMSEAVRDLVVQRAPTLQIRQQAIAEGMRTLRDDGLRAIFDGHTTIEEVVKYT